MSRPGKGRTDNSGWGWMGRWSTLQIGLAAGTTLVLLIAGMAFAAGAMTTEATGSGDGASARELRAVARNALVGLDDGEEIAADVPDGTDLKAASSPNAATADGQPTTAGFTIGCSSDFQPDEDYHGVTKCQLKSSGGFTDQVDLSCIGPAGVLDCKTLPGSVTPPPNGSGSFRMAANTTQETGKYVLVVTGRSGQATATHKVTMRLDYLDPALSSPDYNINCPVASAMAAPAGQTKSVDCSIISWGGYTGPVTLICEPEGSITCRFEGSPVTLVPSGTTPVTLSVQVPNDSPPGAFALQISGKAPGASSARDGLTYTLRINVPVHNGWFPPLPPVTPSFFLACPFNNYTAPQGPPSIHNCILLSYAGFTGEVSLAVQPAMPGVSVVAAVMVSPNPPTPMGFPVELTIDPGLLGPGNHTITVVGTSGGITQSGQLNFTVAE